MLRYIQLSRGLASLNTKDVDVVNRYCLPGGEPFHPGMTECIYVPHADDDGPNLYCLLIITSFLYINCELSSFFIPSILTMFKIMSTINLYS